MGFVRGVAVVLGSLAWLGALPILIVIETLRYGLELVVELMADVWDTWDRWVNTRRDV